MVRQPAARREAFAFWSSPLAMGLATAVLLYPAFFPLNWGFLGWVALVPLLGLCVRPNGRRVWLAGWLAGLAFALPALQWLRIASPPMYVTWIALAVFISLHFLIFVAVTRTLCLRGRLPLLIAAPAVWTALEYGRAHVGIGFSWYYLGHTQHDYLPMIQIADLFGAYGVSFLLVMVNAAVFQLIGASGARVEAGEETAALADRLRPRFSLTLAIVFAALAATLGYGSWRINEAEFEPGPRVALVQGDLPQALREDRERAHDVFFHFASVAELAYQADPKPDIIFWSETSVPDWWCDSDPSIPAELWPDSWWDDLQYQVKLHEHLWLVGTHADQDKNARRAFIPTLYGMNRFMLTTSGKRLYNSAVLLERDGRFAGRYDKMYRVPFGEYVPWEETLPILRWLTPYEGNYGIESGTEHTIFEVGGVANSRFAVLICYEDTVPHLAPQYFHLGGAGGPPPDFFVNISNDGWFKGWEEHEQHLATARFRAVECRRALARAVNMGISCVIDGNGRLVAMPANARSWSEAKAREALVLASVPIDRRISWYVRHGDWFSGACVALVLGGLVWVVARRVLHKRVMVAAG